jgi:pimeloyl-ACP methyl ester carboxylesterase
MNSYPADQRITVNGVELHYAVSGEGRPVLLVHGNGENHHLLEMEISQLSDAGYRVYAPDSRGHGANKPLPEYHYTDMAEDMFCFIRELGLEKPFYFGHSDGGIIGLLLELKHPGTLGKMAVSGTNLSPEGLDPGFLKEFGELNRKNPDPLVTLMLTEPHIEPESLKKIAIPVLVTVGSKDLILPEETGKIADHLPDARTVVVEEADHGSYIQGSPVMGRMLIDFFGDGGLLSASGSYSLLPDGTLIREA